jgi:hypothetical protein
MVGLPSILLAACGAGTREIATAAFGTRHPGCESTAVRERPDLEHTLGDQDMKVYEVTGCGADDLYPCFPARWVGRGVHGGATERIPASCSKPEMCTPAGCWTGEAITRERFATDATCPIDRVIVTPLKPPPPPADVAADPQRTQMWTVAHASMAGHLFTARGCGLEAPYVCLSEVTCAPAGPSTQSAPVAAPSAPPGSTATTTSP